MARPNAFAALLPRCGPRELTTLLVPVATAAAVAGGVLTESERRRAHGAGSPSYLTWLLVAAAGVALAAAARGQPLSLAGTPAIRVRLRSVTGLALGGALIAALVSVPLFTKLNDSTTARQAGWAANDLSWLLWAISVVLFGIGVRRLSPRPVASPAGWPVTLPRRREVWMVAPLTAAALVARLVDLQSIPHGLWFDEAQNGLVGAALALPGGLHQVFVSDATQMGALQFYPLGIALHALGNSVWVLRLLPALAGSGTVPLVYVIGSRLYGWRTGVAAATLLAFSAWSITFSRFGMQSMVTVSLDVAAYGCVVLALRSGRLSWYFAGGVLLGLALQGYYVARLVPVVLVALLAYLAVRTPRSLWQTRSGVAVFAVAAAITFLPMGLFALQHPDAYEARTTTVSIFSAAGGGGQSNPLPKSVKTYLLMFGYSGDRNGRHNLPGSPMLDWLTAALFFSGVCLCLMRSARWEYVFPVLWLGAALAGGVFSLLGEAPQAHRTLEASVAASLVAGIFLGEIWRLGSGAGVRVVWIRHVTAVAVVTVALAAAAVMNVHKYFFLQARDAAVWSDMGAAKLAAARLLRDHPRGELWISDFFVGDPTLRFLAPRAQPLTWEPETLPFENSGRDGTIIVLDPDHWEDMGEVKRFYPRTRFEVFRTPSGLPLLYAALIPRRDIANTHGALVESGSTTSIQRTGLSTTGTARAPEHLAATVELVTYGRYRLAWSGHGSVRPKIVLDGSQVAAMKPLTLAAGLHSVAVDIAAHSAAGDLELALSGNPLRALPPAEVFNPLKVWPRGVVGDYRGQDGQRLMRIDPVLGIFFHVLPVPPPFTVVWRGDLYAPRTGRYLLGTKQVATARLAVDGRWITNNLQHFVLQMKPVRLVVGWHPVEMKYAAVGGFFSAFLYWKPPHRETSVVPSAFLRPPGTTGFPATARPTLAAAAGELQPGDIIDAGEP